MMTISDEDFLVSRDVLLERVGRAVLSSQPTVRQRTSAAYRAAAVDWLTKNRATLTSLICSHPAVVALRNSERATQRGALAGAILDAIAAMNGLPAVATLAVLLADEGLHALCGPTS